MRSFYNNSTFNQLVSNKVTPNVEWGVVDNISQLSIPHETGYGWTRGRIKTIMFEVDGSKLGTALNASDLEFKLYRNSSVVNLSDRINITNIGELFKSGFVEVNGTVCTISIPYDEMLVRNEWFAITLKTARDDIYLRTTEYTMYSVQGYQGLYVNTAFTEKTGSSWKPMLLPQSQETAPIIPALIYEVYEGHYLDLAYEFQYTPDGSTWIPLQHHFFGAETELNFDMTDIVDVTETSRAKIRVRVSDRNGEHYAEWDKSWFDNQSDWVESGNFFIFKHVAPLKPINLFVSDTAVIDRSLPNRLSWKHVQNSVNNRQGRATLKWRTQGNVDWNTVEIAGMSQYWDAPADTFPLGTVEWQVMTYNSVDMEGPYSDIVTFTAKDTPAAPTILAPPAVVEMPSPTVSWDHSHVQTHYQVNVLTTSENIIWTSGEAEDTATVCFVNKYLDNLSTFKLQVRVKTSDGLWTEYAETFFDTDYNFPPPSVVTTESLGGFIRVSYTNPAPTGKQPVVARNDVFKYVNNEWILIGYNAPYSFDDYAATNVVPNRYFVRSTGSNGAYTDSEIAEASIEFSGILLYVVSDPEGTVTQFRRVTKRKSTPKIKTATHEYKGRKGIVKKIGTMQTNIIEFSLKLNRSEKEALEAIYNRFDTICYRDGSGRLAYGVLEECPVNDLPNGEYEVDLFLEAIDYVETVTGSEA
ncbi:hypothetical protein [Bacillus benzoevorans]|uniref:Uncharacterized protein n=1 Tax=Bacillus benzoevorans TaxID=1456 RepID=A0A7X0HTC5_9BACI|nr:hypothetical protein [Bacillus benzoevorans]